MLELGLVFSLYLAYPAHSDTSSRARVYLGSEVARGTVYFWQRTGQYCRIAESKTQACTAVHYRRPFTQLIWPH